MAFKSRASPHYRHICPTPNPDDGGRWWTGCRAISNSRGALEQLQFAETTGNLNFYGWELASQQIKCFTCRASAYVLLMRGPNRPRFDVLTSAGFLTALTLLLLNDWILKARFATWWTGKLSDVTGLAAFALFFSALLPGARRAIFALIAIAFVLWKSPLIDPLLTWWNHTGWWPLARVIDYTDWLALGVLPLACLYLRIRLRIAPRRAALPGLRSAIAVLSVFAFAATSRRITEKDGSRYVMPGSVIAVHRGIQALGFETERPVERPASTPPTQLQIALDHVGDFERSAEVTLVLSPLSAGETIMTVKDFTYMNAGPTPAEIHEALLLQLVNPLRHPATAIPNQSPQVSIDQLRLCFALGFGPWHPYMPRGIDTVWYQKPAPLVLNLAPYTTGPQPVEYRHWRALALAPQLPDAVSSDSSLRSPEFSFLELRDFLSAWDSPTPDSLILLGVNFLPPYNNTAWNLEVRGRWFGDTLHGRAVSPRRSDTPAEEPWAAAAAVRYSCADQTMGLQAQRAVRAFRTSFH